MFLDTDDDADRPKLIRSPPPTRRPRPTGSYEAARAEELVQAKQRELEAAQRMLVEQR